jgi:hypothetical protein|tara:strand:+ start:617 stop:829 length:213 start_codon:yes stop_codon:yes gene_type:complete
MSKKDEQLDQVLQKIEELTQMIVDNILDGNEEFTQEILGEAVQTFRISEKVYNEMEKELGEGWADKIGVT